MYRLKRGAARGRRLTSRRLARNRQYSTFSARQEGPIEVSYAWHGQRATVQAEDLALDKKPRHAVC